MRPIIWNIFIIVDVIILCCMGFPIKLEWKENEKSPIGEKRIHLKEINNNILIWLFLFGLLICLLFGFDPFFEEPGYY